MKLLDVSTGDKNVEIKGVPALIKQLGKLEGPLFSENFKKEVALFVIAQIQTRTSEGKEVDGSTFKPYSPGYAKFRKKAGHQIDIVNLFFSGSMMSAMTFDSPEDDTVRIFFQSTTDRKGMSNAAKAFFLQEDRDFFGVSVVDKDSILEMVKKYLDDLIGEKAK